MSYHDHMDIDERERVRAAERESRPTEQIPTPEEVLLERVASCVWITAGSLPVSKSRDVARELLRRGWIATDKIDPNFRESGSVRL